MRYPYRILFSVLVLVAATSASIAGQGTYKVPKTAWGDPDLQGTWRVLRLPLERPERYADRKDGMRTDAEIAAALARFEQLNTMRLAGKGESRGFRANPNMNDVWVAQIEKPRFSKRTSGIVDPPDGKLPPWTLEQVKRWEMREMETAKYGDGDTLLNRTYNERCIPHYTPPVLSNWGLEFGGGTSTFGGRFETITEEQVVTFMDGLDSSTYGAAPFRIIQMPGHVVIMNPEYSRFRVVTLGKKETIAPGVRSWRGDTYGYFEGDTLVVEVANIFYEFPLIPGYFGGDYPGSGERLKVTERYKRVGPEDFIHSWTVNDPDVFVRPYTVEVEGYLDNAYKDLPSICHEVNLIDLGGLLATARLDESAAWENMRELQVERDKWYQMRKKQAEEYAAKAKSSAR